MNYISLDLFLGVCDCEYSVMMCGYVGLRWLCDL